MQIAGAEKVDEKNRVICMTLLFSSSLICALNGPEKLHFLLKKFMYTHLKVLITMPHGMVMVYIGLSHP